MFQLRDLAQKCLLGLSPGAERGAGKRSEAGGSREQLLGYSREMLRPGLRGIPQVKVEAGPLLPREGPLLEEKTTPCSGLKPWLQSLKLQDLGPDTVF